MEYNFREIEKRWQERWAKEKTFAAKDNSDKPKYYVLDMFPYPSGAGLHVGHPLGYIASDIMARYKRHKGFNVLHPMGYDSFGLPAEQYAIQTGQHPAVTTEQNIARYREQLDKIGFSFDWDREVRTSDPDYYKWTQWIFIQIFNSWYNPKTDKAEHIDTLMKIFETEGFKGLSHDTLTGSIEQELQSFTADEWKAFDEKRKSDILMNFRLAYLGEAYVNWCPALGTVLANDEVKDGVSERGGYPVERKLMKQWSMRITAYAQRLLDGLETIDWTESLKESQRYWIGKSEGTSLKFRVAPSNSPKGGEPSSANSSHLGRSGGAFIEVFTTRPDTIFGVSFVTLAPEHELVEKITTPEQKSAVEDYVNKAKNRSERERQADVNKVSGVFTGAYVEHPFSGKPIPVWVGDYVLAGYGTGAVMAVPAHDERDYKFAKHFGLSITQVITPTREHDFEKNSWDEKEGKLINSDFLNGLEVKAAIRKSIEEIEKRNLGKGKTNFRLRDAVFGRQRYWGEPIPIYYKNGIPHALPESELPLVLPEVDKFLPTEDGEPPLARAKDWKYAPSNSPKGGEHDGTAYSWQTAANSGWTEMKSRSKELRNNQTEAEAALWQHIRNNQLDFKFRRQQVIGYNIADFVCLEKKLIIEVDGEIHNQQKEYDAARTLELEKQGFTVIRFENKRIFHDIENVLSEIKKQLQVLPLGEDLGGAYPLETTTMPGWAGSSWYFLRYMDANNSEQFVSKKLADYWQNIDLYIGGSEHATGHLLYFRFWTKFLHDMNFIAIDEPAKKLINQGMILGMSEKIFHFFGLNVAVIDEEKGITGESYVALKNGKQLFFPEEKHVEIYVSADAKNIFDDGALIVETNIDINFVTNNSLDFKSFSERKLNNSDSIFFFKEGYYYAGKFFDLEKQEVSGDNFKFLTRSETEKMSKSKYNVVTPDDICEKFGADTLRLYEMFLGPLEQSKPWNTNGITGVSGFLKKLWKLAENVFEAEKASPVGGGLEGASKAELKSLHKTIKKITEDIERFSFNTSVSNFMICVNELTEQKCNKRSILEPLLVLISPYAPHIAEELWSKLGHTESIAFEKFPEVNESYLVDDSFTYPISFNGKTRLNIELPANLSVQEIEKEVTSREDVQKYLEGKTPKKVIIVPKKIVNFVV